MKHEITCYYNGNKITALVDEDEVSRVSNEINWLNIQSRVIDVLGTNFPDAKELYGDKFGAIVDSITKQVKIFMCDDRLSVDELEDTQIENIIRELYSPFAEIRTDFYDEIEKFWSVDAWRTDNENEEGVVVAKVFADRVEFTEDTFAECMDVIRAIKNLPQQ